MATSKISAIFSDYKYACITTSGAIILVLVALFRSSDLPTLESELSLKQKELSNIKNNITSATKIKDHITTLETAVKKINARIAPSDNVLNLGYFYKLATDASVKISNINKVDDSKSAKIEKPTITYTLTTEATFSNTLKFISLIDGFQYYTKISQFSASVIANKENATTENLVSCNLSLEMYRGAVKK